MRASVRMDLKGDPDLIEKDCTEAVRLDPRSAETYGLRGMARADRRDDDRAIADFDMAVKLDPKETNYYHNRGNAYLMKGEFDRAIADYDMMLKIDPKNNAAYAARGGAWARKGDLDRAIADWTQAIRLAPDYAGTYAHRGQAYSMKGENDKAIADFDAALKLEPGNRHAPSSSGGRPAWPRRNIRTRSPTSTARRELDANDAYTYAVRAAVRTYTKEYDKALADIDRSIRLDPKSSWPHFSRAVIAFLTGRDPESDLRAVIDLDGWKGRWSTTAALVGHFAARRAKRDDAARRWLADATKGGADPAAWPYPALRFLRREIDEKALLAQAVDDTTRTKARCYLGLDALFSGRPDRAGEHFRWIKEHGDSGATEYLIAVAELERLEAKPRP